MGGRGDSDHQHLPVCLSVSWCATDVRRHRCGEPSNNTFDTPPCREARVVTISINVMFISIISHYWHRRFVLRVCGLCRISASNIIHVIYWNYISLTQHLRRKLIGLHVTSVRKQNKTKNTNILSLGPLYLYGVSSSILLTGTIITGLHILKHIPYTFSPQSSKHHKCILYVNECISVALYMTPCTKCLLSPISWFS